MAVERMLGKLSTRRYPVGLEPVGAEAAATASGTSKSAVPRRFVAATERALADLVAAELTGLDLVALMVDGAHFGEHCWVVALGIAADAPSTRSPSPRVRPRTPPWSGTCGWTYASASWR
jgi:hypothetical protein